MILKQVRTCTGVLLIGVVVATSAMWGVRVLLNHMRDDQCKEKLTLLYLALDDYSRGHRGFLPPPYVENRKGASAHSWRALILPSIMPYEYLYRQYRFSEPWNSPHNNSFANSIDAYTCPTHTRPLQVTNYVAVVGDNTLWASPKGNGAYESRIIGESTHWPYVEGCKLSSGSPNTILLVESVQSDIRWSEPRDITLDDFISTIQNEPKGRFYNKHVNGIRAIDTSGRIRIIDPTGDIGVIREMFLVKPGDDSGDTVPIVAE